MSEEYQDITEQEVADARRRRVVAAHLQDIESNPLSSDQVAMFEMFEREAWPHDRRLAYLQARVSAASEASAAE